jgi:hypothetical protein
VYVSGDNASIGTVAEIARRTPAIDAVVLHAGAARVQARFQNRALSLDSIRAAAAAAILGSGVVVPAHYDGWAHFSEGRDDLARAFDDAGLAARLRLGDHGTWTPLRTQGPRAGPHQGTGPKRSTYRPAPAAAGFTASRGPAWMRPRRDGPRRRSSTSATVREAITR